MRITQRAAQEEAALAGGYRRAARAAALFALANARYWRELAPVVRAGLRDWEARARAIPDPRLRAMALGKLRDERFNVEAAAMFAAFAPKRARVQAAKASIAVEIIYNLLDALTEEPIPDPIRSGEHAFRALGDPFSAGRLRDRASYYARMPWQDDGGYLNELVLAAHRAIGALPAIEAVRAEAQGCAARCGEAQVRMHAAPFIGDEQLHRWAVGASVGDDLRWQELVAGAAASGVTLHALIAAAADPSATPADAQAIGWLYLRVSAVSMILDSLVDRERDLAQTGRPGFVRHWADPAELRSRTAYLLAQAVRRACSMNDGSEHVARIGGIVAYYTSDDGAESALARPVIATAHRELRPLIWVTLPSLRAWRAAKRLRNGRSSLALAA